MFASQQVRVGLINLVMRSFVSCLAACLLMGTGGWSIQPAAAGIALNKKPVRHCNPPGWCRKNQTDVLVYDLVTRRFKGENGVLDVRGEAGHTQFIRVTSLNPLYRLKATYTTLIWEYGTPKAFLGNTLEGLVDGDLAGKSTAKATVAELEEFGRQATSALTLALAYRAGLEQVKSFSRQVALDSATTVNALKSAAAKVGIVPPAGQPVAAASLLDGFRSDSVALADLETTGLRYASNLAPKIAPAALRLFKQQLDSVHFLLTDLRALAKETEFRQYPVYWVVMMQGSYHSDTRNNPLLLSGDQVRVKLDIIKRPEFQQLPPPDFTPLSFTIQVVHGLSMDFSAGLVFNRLYDNKYALEPGTVARHDTVLFDQRFKTVRETSGNGFKPGLATLLHVRFKTAPGFSIGLSGGATLVADAKSIVQYHAGPSVMIGKQQRIVLTLGRSWGYVNRAAPGYEEAKRLPFTVSEVPTYQQFAGSWMVGLTYNLSGKLKPATTFEPAAEAADEPKTAAPAAAKTAQ